MAGNDGKMTSWFGEDIDPHCYRCYEESKVDDEEDRGLDDDADCLR
jgi:hypothetical protein